MSKTAEIKRLTVIGAGNQGPKIACRAIVYGLTVALHDQYSQALDTALTRIDDWLSRLWMPVGVGPDQVRSALARLKPATTLADAVDGADLIIETVPENLDLKRRVFSEIDRLASIDAILATNSSSLPCSRLGDMVRRPERLFNLNFSHPQEPEDRLVELMKGRQTADQVILAAERFVRSLDMVPVTTLKEIMGFSFNRTWRAVKKEVLRLVDQGYVSPEDLDRAWMMQFGSPWGPFGLMDIIGLETVRDIENQYFQDSGEESDRPPKLLDEMIAQGRLGFKAGRGFYTYPDPDYKNPIWLRKQGPWAEELKARLERKM